MIPVDILRAVRKVIVHKQSAAAPCGGNIRRLKVSLRSRGVVNVTAIAKHHGGGGHANGQAAGFHVPVTLGDDGASPYVVIDRCLDAAMS